MRSFENALIRRVDAQRQACGIKPQQPKPERVRVWRAPTLTSGFDFDAAIRREMKKAGVR
jgi:hypothetical protein